MSSMMSWRTKLEAKKPAFRVVKRKKTFIACNGRDRGLTQHQQAWARSLSGSLSGWRARTWYHRARGLADSRHEEEVEARRGAEGEERAEQRVTARVELGAEAGDEEEEEEEDAGTPAGDGGDGEEFEEEEDLTDEAKAAAWADKARQMHLAGMGSKIMIGWDPVKKTYIRNFEMEECLTRLAAARQAASSEGSDDEEGEENESSDDDGEGEAAEVNENDAEVSSSHTSHTMSSTQPTSATSQPPSPTYHTSPPPPPPLIVDWRAKARIGVEKKNLSVTKGWSTLTWNQKSNINERYLVLEDDGVDIQAMRERKATSDEVTALILARAAAAGEGAQTAPTGLPTFMPINGPGSGFQPSLRASGGAGSAAPVTPDNEGTTQPFSLSEPYRPQPSHARKRKRWHDAHPQDADDASNKKKKVEANPTDEVLAAQSLDEMKQKRLRGVFRPARSVHGEGDSISRVVFVHAGEEGREVYVSTRGFDHVMSEVRFLANADGANGEMTLHDPDFDPELSYGLSTMAGVTVATYGLDGTVVHGETQVLAGLFKMLGEEKLLHRTGWEWDGLVLRAEGGLDWELSGETQGVLREIEEMLREGKREGVEVLVGVVSA